MQKLLYLVFMLSFSSGLNAMVEKYNFDNAFLLGSQFISANFKGVSFVGACLAESDLRGADFEGADLTNASLDACIINTKPSYRGNVLISATNFHGATVAGLKTGNLSPETVQFIMAQARK